LTSNEVETEVVVTANIVEVPETTPKRSKTEIEELIIGEVSGRRCLWDKSHPNYKQFLFYFLNTTNKVLNSIILPNDLSFLATKISFKFIIYFLCTHFEIVASLLRNLHKSGVTSGHISPVTFYTFSIKF
jgi:hypothetical protein